MTPDILNHYFKAFEQLKLERQFCCILNLTIGIMLAPDLMIPIIINFYSKSIAHY